MTRFASAPDARLAYDAAGAGDPPMIFVHGWCCDRSYFDPANSADDLRRACPAITIGQTVGAGHFIQLEVPDQVNAMIERFLQSLT